MKPPDRARLTSALSKLVGKIAADLRVKMRAPGSTRERAQQLHADEKVGEDFDVWTDLLSRRASVLWVLKSVYVRVLEDRGLLNPGRLFDPESQQLFERLAPHLGETTFLKWVYRDLASSSGGLPELFSPQPAEVALPSNDLSRELIAFWRHRDADTGASWNFEEERFEGELMGDLYQELDPVVKERFALCQTPDFVRAFILDRTLTPAIETFGADQVRMLDPACGSGHFLIDGLKRLVAATATQHPKWSKAELVRHALDRVVGVDLNDYACGLARARLVMTASELAGVSTLADTSAFHPHIYWADGLEQVEREEAKPSLQFGLFEAAVEKPRATLTRSDVRATLKTVYEKRFHAVVANPPYIVEGDDSRKEYHREKIGRTQRYVSAYRQYSLGSPFAERCFQLAERGGFIGIITSNNFMKREFGRPLIENVLANIDLQLVVDTSQAYIPFHGTPTVLLFARNQQGLSESVRAVMGRRREPGTPADPAKGRVWSSIVGLWESPGSQDEFVTVVDVSRDIFRKHPWSLGGGGASALKDRLEESAELRLRDLAEIGAGAVTREDDVYLVGRESALRRGIPADQIRALVEGDAVRDWSLRSPTEAIWPYNPADLSVVQGRARSAVSNALWPWRSRLVRRVAYGKTQIEHGLEWFEYSMFFAERFRDPLSIAFPDVASHNHFVLDRGGRVYKDTAPIIKLKTRRDEAAYCSLLGFLNSSSICFWMKQVCHPKTHAGQRHHEDPSRAVYQYKSTRIGAMPVPALDRFRERLAELSLRIDVAADSVQRGLALEFLNAAVVASRDSNELRARIESRWRLADVQREKMVALQEEIDWLVYAAFGLVVDKSLLVDPERYDALTCPRGGRPFERIHPRVSTIRAKGRTLAMDVGEVPAVGSLPAWAEGVWGRRADAIAASEELRLLETPVFKRAWRDTDQNIAEPRYRSERDRNDLMSWLGRKLEAWASERGTLFSLAQAVAAIQGDPQLMRVAELVSDRADYSLEHLLRDVFTSESVPSHPYHTYTDSGLAKRAVWEAVWASQRREDAGEHIGNVLELPEYSQGSRGKATDFIRTEYWRLRGKLDVPKERFISFTEVPGRSGSETLYGWAGWTPLQRLKAILAVDEELEDGGVVLTDRVGLLDSAWRMLADVGRSEPTVATRLRAELQALLGPEGPSHELLADWKKRFAPPNARVSRARQDEHEAEREESDES